MLLHYTFRRAVSFSFGRRSFVLRHKRSISPIGYLADFATIADQLINELKVVAQQKKSRIKQAKVSDVTEEAASVELAALNKELDRHNKLYFDLNTPEITDAAYDKLVKRAEALVGKYRHLSHLIPTLDVVGLGKTSKFSPFVHSSPMLSLGKAFTRAELDQFLECTEKGLNTTAVDYIIEPKIDGLSLGIIYEPSRETTKGEWVLSKAGTRGDGAVGEDVTENVLQYMKSSIPKTMSTKQMISVLEKAAISTEALNTKCNVEVRGEVFISKQHFNLLNKRRAELGDEGRGAQLATARNAAAGALRKINSGNSTAPIEDRHLQFFAYSLTLHADVSNNNPNLTSGSEKAVAEEAPDVLPRQSDTLQALEQLGFQVAKPHAVFTSREQVLDTCQRWSTEKGQWDFEADGTVVKVNDAQQQAQLGCTSRSPRWAIAYKYADDTVLTKLRGIEVRVGRTGVLTPVGKIYFISFCFADVILVRGSTQCDLPYRVLFLHSQYYCSSISLCFQHCLSLSR